MKNLNFLRNNNNCQKKSSIYATESNLNKQKSLTQKEYANLFKLNNELNTNFNNTNHNLHFKSFQSRRNTNKESRSNSHFYLTSKLNSPENNAIKTFFHYNNRNLSNDKSPKANNIVKSSGLKKNQNLKTESDTELINLDKYNSLVTETMINYRTESMPIDSNNLENREDNLPTFKESIGLNKTLFGKNNNNLNFTYGENYNIKIDVKDKEYRNPIDSRKIIYTNKNIFDNISTSLINIQKMYYDKTIYGIEKFHEFKRNMCKVRISNIVPKNPEISSVFKTRDNNGLDKNSNMNGSNSNFNITGNNNLNNNNMTGMLKKNLGNPNINSEENSKVDSLKERSPESIEKERILEKEKEKECEREREKERRKNKKRKDEIRIKNKIMRQDDMELYAYYKYSFKNFPEGREQFTFDYNLSDLILFGGIVTNKNNHIWILDPCN